MRPRDLELSIEFLTADSHLRELCELYWDRRSIGGWTHKVPEIAELEGLRTHQLTELIRKSSYVTVINYGCLDCKVSFGKYNSRHALENSTALRSRCCDECSERRRQARYAKTKKIREEKQKQAFRNANLSAPLKLSGDPRHCDFCPGELVERHGTGSVYDLYCPGCGHEPANRSCRCCGCLIRERMSSGETDSFIRMCGRRYRHDGQEQEFTVEQRQDIRRYEWLIGQSNTIYAIEITRDKFTFEEPIGGEEGKFSYFCGICRNKHREIKEASFHKPDLDRAHDQGTPSWVRRSELQSARLAEEERQRVEEERQIRDYLASLDQDEQELVKDNAISRANRFLRNRYFQNKDSNPKLAQVYLDQILQRHVKNILACTS